MWNNEAWLVSQDLAGRSNRPAIEASPPKRGFYAWHWWTDSVPGGLDYYYARGYGGQFIVIAPTEEAVIVMTRAQWKKKLSPLELFRETIVPLWLESEK